MEEKLIRFSRVRKISFLVLVDREKIVVTRWALWPFTPTKHMNHLPNIFFFKLIIAIPLEHYETDVTLNGILWKYIVVLIQCVCSGLTHAVSLVRMTDLSRSLIEMRASYLIPLPENDHNHAFHFRQNSPYKTRGSQFHGGI